MIRYWKTTNFWDKVRDSFSLIGSGITSTFAITHVPYTWIVVSGVLTMAGSLISIWMTDGNGNGEADVFEEK